MRASFVPLITFQIEDIRINIPLRLSVALIFAKVLAFW
jgi:hypothetical protein